MLPDTNNRPAVVFQLLIHFCIPIDIGLDLFHPEFFPGLRFLKTDWTFMPKTTVNENSDSLFCEYDIGFAK